MAITEGVFYVPLRRGSDQRVPFSYHYFNEQGLEVGMQHVDFPNHCMIFNPPREWGEVTKRTLIFFKGADNA